MIHLEERKSRTSKETFVSSCPKKKKKKAKAKPQQERGKEAGDRSPSP
jgi:hypothetical protein